MNEQIDSGAAEGTSPKPLPIDKITGLTPQERRDMWSIADRLGQKAGKNSWKRIRRGLGRHPVFIVIPSGAIDFLSCEPTGNYDPTILESLAEPY